MMTAGSFVAILLIAIGLSADCFAVALSGGITSVDGSNRKILRVAASFGLFQAIMPVLGWLAGKTVVDLISNYDHWVAFGLLAIVSGRMLWEALHDEGESERKTDISRPLSLLVLSVATSIDALAVGLSFAFLEVNIAIASPIIGVVAFLLTWAGFVAGRHVARFAGRWAEVTGAVILLGIAIRILLSHIL